MFNLNPIVGQASVLFVATALFFSIVIRIVRYLQRGKLKTADLEKDEENSYVGFSGVTILLALSIILTLTGYIFMANIVFYATVFVLLYFYYYTTKMFYYWLKN